MKIAIIPLLSDCEYILENFHVNIMDSWVQVFSMGFKTEGKKEKKRERLYFSVLFIFSKEKRPGSFEMSSSSP